MSIQTGVTVRKWLSWVVTSLTLTFDLWPWPFAWTLLWELVITPKNFMMIRWWEHSQKGVTDRQTDGQTDGQTENTICRAAWSQLKIAVVLVDTQFGRDCVQPSSFFYISMLAVIDKVLNLWYFVYANSYNVSFFSSKPKQRFPTEHENFADKRDGLFTWRCLDIIYNLHHIILSSQYVIVSMSLSHNTAPLVFMAWWEIRYNWNEFFTSES